MKACTALLFEAYDQEQQVRKVVGYTMASGIDQSRYPDRKPLSTWEAGFCSPVADAPKLKPGRLRAPLIESSL